LTEIADGIIASFSIAAIGLMTTTTTTDTLMNSTGKNGQEIVQPDSPLRGVPRLATTQMTISLMLLGLRSVLRLKTHGLVCNRPLLLLMVHSQPA